MPYLNLKKSHKPVRDYYTALGGVQQLSLIHEGAVAPHFANLLRACASRMNWTLAEQYQIPRKGRRPLRADGVFLDEFKLRHGIWEAKDTDDDLAKEVKKKFSEGYPQDNILFQAPDRAILVQNGRTIFDEPITDPDNLVAVLKLFCEYQPPEFEQWDVAVEEFKERVPELAQSLLELIETERKQNRAFRDAFGNFTNLMRDAINPNLSDKAVEEMLIQHLLTERIFRKVFNNPDFAQRNIIAREIEKVIEALTSRHFSRHDFLRSLDRFYGAIETTAATIEEFSEKQDFLNTVYEKFFQGFSVKVADTHGIVYTPQPIVDFMVRSVDDILRREFGKTDGLASDGVAILDPFVGTGNFILRVLRQMPKSKLPHKYKHELFCNEVMLLPYYIASMNIEHDYYELTGRYEPFDGISLVDTFELAEGRQMPLFAPENTQRVQRQKNTPIFVIIGNPPYNAGQVNENDNNKNRTYPTLDKRVAETYGSASRASLLIKLNDPYVKAIRWATDRVNDEGIVAVVTNNSFLGDLSFDGMRHCLEEEFDAIYVLDLGGNVRHNPKLSGTTHNVFGIQVGVSINLMVRKQNAEDNHKAKIYYANTGEEWRKGEKYDFLDSKVSYLNIEWDEIRPDKKSTWFTSGIAVEFDNFLPIGSRKGKGTRYAEDSIFHTFALGASTNRDAWVYSFHRQQLEDQVAKFSQTYNFEMQRWERAGKPKDVLSFVTRDDTKIKWSSMLTSNFKRGKQADFEANKIRYALYRPFTQRFLYYDKLLVDAHSLHYSFLPNDEISKENVVICL
ncbi:MAG: N-6 DNA methylase, partial [Anaerolineae bacterium]|nr:N-6 DNA methylase [Anaerolineae bacterium]